MHSHLRNIMASLHILISSLNCILYELANQYFYIRSSSVQIYALMAVCVDVLFLIINIPWEFYCILFRGSHVNEYTFFLFSLSLPFPFHLFLSITNSAVVNTCRSVCAGTNNSSGWISRCKIGSKNKFIIHFGRSCQITLPKTCISLRVSNVWCNLLSLCLSPTQDNYLKVCFLTCLVQFYIHNFIHNLVFP